MQDAARSPVVSSSRIPVLLLLAMFAIAARYGPVAHGSSVSPVQTKIMLPPANEEPGAGLEEGEGTDTDADSALPLPPSGVMWAAGDGFLERAKSILDRLYSTSRPSTCQALLLMGYREIGIGAMAQSWLYVGMAIRMVSQLIV